MNERKQNLKLATQRVLISNYFDYHQFLERLYQVLKELNNPYSYLLFAEDLGFSPTNVLRLVVARQRTLSKKSAITIAQHLEFKNTSRRFFLQLVDYNNSKNPQKKEQLFTKLLEIKQQTVSSELDRQRLEYFGEWYYAVVREMVRLHDFRPDPTWIASHIVPKITAEQADKALALLEHIQQIERDPESNEIFLRYQAPMILPADKTANHMSVINFHRHMLKLAQESITRIPVPERELNAITLCLSNEGLVKLREMIHKFCQDALALENLEQPRQQVSQLNIQLFPLSQYEPLLEPGKSMTTATRRGKEHSHE